MSGPGDDVPDLFAKVGHDVVGRARLRFGRPEQQVDRSGWIAGQVAGLDGSAQCVVCDAFPPLGRDWRRSEVGLRNVAVCDLCARLAVTITDYLPDLRSCLSILVLNVEAAASANRGWIYPETGLEVLTEPIAEHIKRQMAAGFYAAACNCAVHVEARAARSVPPFRGKAEAAADAKATPAPDCTGMPVALVRRMPERVVFAGRGWQRGALVDHLVERNRLETAYPAIAPGSLRDRALRHATRGAADLWRAWHDRQRALREAGERQEPLVSRPGMGVLSMADVDAINRVFDRAGGDDRAYCDWCGSADGEAVHDGVSWCCADCRKSADVRRLSVVVDAMRRGAVRWFDHDGRPAR